MGSSDPLTAPGFWDRLCLRVLPPVLDAWQRVLERCFRHDPEAVVTSARKTIRRGYDCFFVTVDGAGTARLRLVTPIIIEPDLTIWIAAHSRSRKVAEIRAGSPVSLGFRRRHARFVYAAFWGRAEILADAETKRRQWRWVLWASFTSGWDHPDYVLIRFVPERLEVLDFYANVLRRPIGLSPVALVRRDGEWIAAPGEPAY